MTAAMPVQSRQWEEYFGPLYFRQVYLWFLYGVASGESVGDMLVRSCADSFLLGVICMRGSSMAVYLKRDTRE